MKYAGRILKEYLKWNSCQILTEFSSTTNQICHFACLTINKRIILFYDNYQKIT